MEDNNPTQVQITDIKMPFWSMVIFMVKASIASIPAFIILSIIGTLVFSLIGGFMGFGRF
ncbi:hypothetical protein LCGC14_0630980 [marine sediment metagenome]|uniref:Uncharacterized protein n=1 Tax=marine sediment metagenome TaxID=412755 RepID=A0A0F9R771_9ZZZZ|nr:hypothetical protein [Methylophaga sp.]HEC58641.1 hypothetical protein [Methylophaga sp.]